MIEHDVIAKKASSLIKRIHNTTIGALDFSGGFHSERVDALLFKCGSSFMIEAKSSRADFLADKKKKSRTDPSYGIGRYRYYACPPGIIGVDELPPKWGLIYVPEKGKCTMPIGYGGWIKTGEGKCPINGWTVIISDSYGTPGAENLRPDKFFSFDDRSMHLESQFLYHLCTRYKRQKFMGNII